MPTTTNYGWTTPADTDLVKDGAAAIRTLGSSIDTTVFNNASAGIAKTIVDAKGDLIAATASDTVSRLAVGTNGQVLLADSAEATGLKWGTPASGGMTLISTTTLANATTTLSSIPQTYNHLVMIITGMTANTSNKGFRGLPNNSASISTYTWIKAGNSPSSKTNTFLDLYGANCLRTNADNSCFIKIDNYTSTTSFKPVNFYSRYLEADGTTVVGILAGGAISTNSAITSFVFDYEGVNTFAGGTVLLYGVK
jgi:hypothetical protein